jgi:hypothetical protein
MAPWLRALLVAIGLVAGLGVSAPAAAQSNLTHYYCWAPDPAMDIVHVGPINPIGPVSERGGYGRKFAEELKRRGVTGTMLQAYCTMRPGLDQIRRSKAALPVESCFECAGATRFAEVPWSGDAILKPASPKPLPPLRAQANAPSAPVPANPTIPSGEDENIRVVVLGNVETGEVVRDSSKPNLLSIVRQQALALRPTGWKTLLVARTGGVGMVACLKNGDQWEFFAGHGPEFRKVKADLAAEAEPAELLSGQKAQPCGKPWSASFRYEGERETGVIDYVKGKIRQQVIKGRAPGGIKASCPKSCGKGFIRSRSTCMCVRG